MIKFDKSKYLKHIFEPDERLRFSKVFHQATLCLDGQTTFSDFLDTISLEKFLGLFHKYDANCFVAANGGHDSAERMRLAFSIDNMPEEFDIEIIVIKSSSSELLAHRAVLGSIIGLGIDRGKIGDINIFETQSFVFADKSISKLLVENLTKIGHIEVMASIFDTPEYMPPVFRDYREENISLNSLRLDLFLSKCFHLSREETKRLIQNGKAFTNWTIERNPVRQVKQGENITLRGFGRVEICNISAKGNKFTVSIKLPRGLKI